jgi:hypothetical protein
MLSMGITLAPSDFVRVGKRPNAVIIQFLLCYAMMPLLALALGIFFRLDPALLAGMVLVGSINGGQASNLCTYIAKGNVALSVLMTTATTLGAIFMTPVLCKSILGTVVPVDAAGIAVSTIQVVLAPIAIGMTTNKFFPKFVKAILPFAPLVGIASTCLLVASAVAQVSEPILNAGLKLQVRRSEGRAGGRGAKLRLEEISTTHYLYSPPPPYLPLASPPPALLSSPSSSSTSSAASSDTSSPRWSVSARSPPAPWPSRPP